jgi:diadenosine tetraphosphate (Ap4A) HIT family hydrolase
MIKYDKNNIFAKIIRGEIPCDKVYEDAQTLAFHDISKSAPIHILVIPKGEYTDLCDFIKNANNDEIANFFKKVGEVANAVEATNAGFRVISNVGRDASQSVLHFHIHILAGKPLGALVTGDTNH